MLGLLVFCINCIAQINSYYGVEAMCHLVASLKTRKHQRVYFCDTRHVKIIFLG